MLKRLFLVALNAEIIIHLNWAWCCTDYDDDDDATDDNADDNDENNTNVKRPRHGSTIHGSAVVVACSWMMQLLLHYE